jgi:hypothetical protein
MPEGLQIYNLKRLFYKLNPEADFDDVDLDALDPEATFPENIGFIKEENRRFRWDIPRGKETQVRDLRIWTPHVSSSLMIWTTSVPIKRQNMRIVRKNKAGSKRIYKKTYGRIQVTVDKEWIGREAKIIVRIPR